MIILTDAPPKPANTPVFPMRLMHKWMADYIEHSNRMLAVMRVDELRASVLGPDAGPTTIAVRVPTRYAKP